jgi:acetoin utilization protein AcuB
MSDNLVHRPVGDVMTPYLITCSPWTSLAEAHELMSKNRIRRLPVLDEKTLVGIVTREDVLASVSTKGGHRPSADELHQRLSAVAVQAVMSKKPLTLYQSDTIGRAAEIMLDNKIGAVPVLEADGQLVGIVTESDLFRAIVRKWRDDNLIFSGAH